MVASLLELLDILVRDLLADLILCWEDLLIGVARRLPWRNVAPFDPEKPMVEHLRERGLGFLEAVAHGGVLGLMADRVGCSNHPVNGDRDVGHGAIVVQLLFISSQLNGKSRRRRFYNGCEMIAELALAAFVLQTDTSKVSKDLTSAYELLTPAGQTVSFNGRPVDLCMSVDGKTVFVKDNASIRRFDADSLQETGRQASKEGSSLTGIALSPDGKLVWSGNSASELNAFDFSIESKPIPLPAIAMPRSKRAAYPCGVELIQNGAKALVCLSMKNSLIQVDLGTSKVDWEVPTDVAPFQVRVAGNRAFVSCQGGRMPTAKDRTALSAGSAMPVDSRGVALTGVVDVIDLETQKKSNVVEVGLQPSCMLIVGDRLVVCNGNSDSVSFIDLKNLRVHRTLTLKPDVKLPFGSMPNGLATNSDRSKLWVSLAGNNAIAQVALKDYKIEGFIPTAWFPSALVVRGDELWIACTKGFGSLADRRKPEQGHNTHDHLGALQKVALPNAAKLAEYSKQVLRNTRSSEILRALETGLASTRAVPVPKKVGEPSVLKHVVFVLKENRTYDQVFGDIPTGDGDPKLCVFGEKVTPNQHALAREFVLLDNYYCNGVLSADGHTWAMEGNVTPYLERAFGGFARSYDYGSDAITYSSSGYLWDPILASGLSFRNFGCEDSADVPKDWKLTNIWRSFEQGKTTKFDQNIGIARLKEYSSGDYPGWNMAIPDVLRMDRFLKEFRQWEAAGTMPNLVFVYLPQDHTAGTSPGYPTPASFIADNDLALGRLVDALSHSKFWKDTVLFANEDDPQAGFDHVDGHRSICLVVSPYTRRAKTVKQFYNQDSVFHTILRIFGHPAINQKVASGPVMWECFSNVPDLTPYNVRDPEVDLSKINAPLSALKGSALHYARASTGLKFDHPDFDSGAQDDLMNRILWNAMKGDSPYPAKYAGAHGRGLAKRGLKKAQFTDD